MKDKHYASVDELIADIAGIPIEDLVDPDHEGPHLISRDELLAAGALYVPPARRKSLGRGEQRDLFSDAVADDESPDETASES